MRSAHRVRPSLPIGRIPHKHALQLHLIAQILDGLPQLEAQVLDDLAPRSVRRDVGLDLLQDTKRYVEAALLAADFLDGVVDPKAFLLAANLRAQAESALCIIDQTERRVLDGQTLPSTAKRLSMFESHADTLRKRDQVVFGHSVCLSFGKAGVVLAADILRGNPADATLAVAAIAQVEQHTGRTPHDAAMDLGFASHDNGAALKDLGVQRVAFPKGRRIDGQKACGSRRVQRKRFRFRAGVEGLISWLQRSLAMGRSRWKGEQSFCAYVWGVLVTARLQALAGAS